MAARLKEALLKPLLLERKQSYKDRSVEGGLGPYVWHWAALLIQNGQLEPAETEAWGGLRSRFEGYESFAEGERQLLVEEALDLLGLNGKKLQVRHKGGRPPAGSDPAGPVNRLTGLGSKRALALARLGIHRIIHLLHYFPRAWQDRGKFEPIGSVKVDDVVTICGQVRGSSNFRTRGRMTITEVAIQDESGVIFAMYFNQPFQQRRFKTGATVVMSGRVSSKRNQMQLSNPEAEVLPEGGEEQLIHTGRIVPIYPLSKDLTQRIIRTAQWHSVGGSRRLVETLPETIRKKLNLRPFGESIEQLHFPTDWDALAAAKRRLVFDEFFHLVLATALRRSRVKAEEAPALAGNELAAEFIRNLPFKMTDAQARVWKELEEDIVQPRPMQRLLQGDVGSGKTIIAALALVRAWEAGYQGAMMAPTEILADQHFKNLSAWLQPLGIEVLRLRQAARVKERKEINLKLESGRPLVVVGTHALIQESVNFSRLGMVVVDEQHRFGVEQRLKLAKKSKLKPHVLVMTATPIPRTLAMTVYGDLDVSILDEMPPGRSPVETSWLKPKERQEALDMVKREVDAGRQAYIVYALVDESDKTEWKAASVMAEDLAKNAFPDLEVDLLHGKMKSEEKNAIMERFKAGKSQVLVATTVIEVGVDVPNATVMVVEDADRFGLAQLHQLRGRVGRGAEQSYCCLVGFPKTDVGKRRLEAMVETCDGFKIAEEDLKLRGPGEILGLRQSGLPDLKLADLVKDQKILIEAKNQAEAIIKKDPTLSLAEHRALSDLIAAKFTAKMELGDVG